jgi:hypothetical protein
MDNKKAWASFAIGTTLCLVALFVAPQFVWIPLPFACTGLALLFDAI